MAGLIADGVFLQAFQYIDNCTGVRVLTASATNLIAATTLDTSNYGAVGAGSSSNGRKMQCLVSDTSDMAGIAVSVTGSATDVGLYVGSGQYIQADITSAPISLNASTSDTVDLGTFSVWFKDPA